MLSCPIFKTNQIQNVSLDTIRPLLPSQHLVVPSKEASRRRCEVDGFRRLLFQREDVSILANPTSCLNDMCINGCIALLFSSVKPPDSRRFAVFLTYDLLCVHYNASDESLWKGTRHTTFWTKDIWIIPIHRLSPVGHWVLCVALISHHELRLFDSLAEEKPWQADVQVCILTCARNNTNYASNRVL